MCFGNDFVVVQMEKKTIKHHYFFHNIHFPILFPARLPVLLDCSTNKILVAKESNLGGLEAVQPSRLMSVQTCKTCSEMMAQFLYLQVKKYIGYNIM